MATENPTTEAPAPTTTAPSPDNTGANFQSSSLYVGDLAADVNEGLLFEIFNAVGPVASIRVCRDAVTRRSLGYAYVNFHQVEDAERALDTMNYTMIKSKPCRIMWSQRDPSLRRSGAGNIFVKNLHKSIDNKQLYDTFSLFGNILSCKVVQDPSSGESVGYGYVHYETNEAAEAAIEKLDGMLIDGQEVNVSRFMKRQERPGGHDFTNCYVKNIPTDWDDERLNKEFAAFGEIMSAKISYGKPTAVMKKKMEAAKAEDGEADSKEEDEKKEEDTVQLGYGFVNFKEHDGAAAAIEALNDREFPSKDFDGSEITVKLYVGRAQKKSERERELASKFEAEKMERINKFQGVNLYVKNLDESVTDDILREQFSSKGTITSARVMRDTNKDGVSVSRGFGFVCFSSPEEATKAVNELNGTLIGGKPIFVALAQRKDARRAQLEAQNAARGPMNMMGRMGGGPMGYPGPMYMQPRPGGMPYPMMAPQQMMQQGGRGPGPRGMYPMPVYGQHPGGRGGRGPGGRGGRGGGPGGRGPASGPGGVKFNQQARNAVVPPAPPAPVAPAAVQPQAMIPAEGAPLTPAALAAASPEDQKNMIGERLYPLIHASQPELAGKITGMLLEMDNSELLHLLESPESLNSKITEAIEVLQQHDAA